MATPPKIDPVDFGAAVQAHAQQRRRARTQKVYPVMDAALWLWDLADDRLATALKTLDIHHARGRPWAIAQPLHGRDMPDARALVHPLLNSLRTDGKSRGGQRLEQLLQAPRCARPPPRPNSNGRGATSRPTATTCTTGRWRRRAPRRPDRQRRLWVPCKSVWLYPLNA